MAQIFCARGHANEGLNDFCTTCGAAVPREGDAPSTFTDDNQPTTRNVAIAPDHPVPTTPARPLHARLRVRIIAVVAAVGLVAAAIVGLALGTRSPTRAAMLEPPARSGPRSPAIDLPPSTSSTTSTSTSLSPSTPTTGPSFPLLDGASVEAGPTTSSAPFGPPPAASVQPGQEVQIECASYGDSESADGATSNVWDYTSTGWIADVYVNTGTTSPAGDSCKGSVSSPGSSGIPLSATGGPFPLMSDGSTVDIYSGDSLDAGVVDAVPEGAFVTLVCSEDTGVTVPAPSRIAGAGSNAQWDQVSTPVSGWVPDSWVDSDSNGSVAPSCSD